MKTVLGRSILQRPIILLFGIFCLFGCGNCSTKSDPNPVQPPVVVKGDMDMWLTTANQTQLLQKQSSTLLFTGTSTGRYPEIIVDPSVSYQTIDGFGYTLTGGSASLINTMGEAAANALLQELFGSGESSIGVSYLRVSIGASDLSSSVFSYDDLPAGQTDSPLAKFSLSQDTIDLIPVLKKILAINPAVKILGSPWSPPVWMKDNGNSIGGQLLPAYYPVYAQYFVKYIEAMKAAGIPIDAITIQNEPQHGGNNPSMLMSAEQQAEFVKNHLGPAFRAAGITTKIIIWDHNCDNPGYPLAVLNDPAAKTFIDGSAFHLYNGDISALSTVHNAHPDKNLYFTEQWTGAKSDFGTDLIWHSKHVVIGSMLNWSKLALEWNLASDPSFGPHTLGGCTECKGALTIQGASVTRNVGYYIIAQASKFIPAGSQRIASTQVSDLQNVAFKTPSGKMVLMVLNSTASAVGFNIKFNDKWVYASLPENAVATFIW